MNPEIKIPDNAVKYILFQRTAYLLIPGNIFYKKLNKHSPWSLYNPVVLLESICRKKAVKRLFNADMQNEYESIRSYLPENCSKILDIGCGVAGIDVLLHRHYDCDDNIKFYLLDKTSVDKKVYYFFEKKGSFYNSLEIAQRILCDNGISGENIYLLEVTADYDIKAESGLDLVISLISWGFHYPVSTYLDQVHDLLKPEGRLIMDIRQSTGGQQELEKKFAKVTIISDDNFLRVLAIK